MSYVRRFQLHGRTISFVPLVVFAHLVRDDHVCMFGIQLLVDIFDDVTLFGGKPYHHLMGFALPNVA